MWSEPDLESRQRTAPEQFEIAGQTLLLREVAAADGSAVLALHQRVFGTCVDAEWFYWKYQSGAGEALGIWCGDELIALCGGVSRAFFHCGMPVRDLQLADVMVAPHWRGVLTRRSPFFRVSERFYNSRIGRDRPFSVGFGFPNARHMRLAAKLGIAFNSGEVAALSWPVPDAACQRPAFWAFEMLDADATEFDAQVQRAWLAMRANALPRYWLGLRDADFVRWRFVQRPDVQYGFLSVRRPWHGHPTGVAVVRLTEPGELLWLDWVGPPDLLALGWRLCMAESQRLGARRLSMWASAAVEVSLGSVAVAQRDVAAWLGVPTMSDLRGQDVMSIPWWFMAGDSDFM